MTIMLRSRGPVSADPIVVPFEPHPWFRGGHAQTIAGRYLPGRRLRLPSTYHEIDVDEGDRLSVLESIPDGWRPGGPMALMVHGLAGCVRAPYLVRVAIRLVGIGVRVVRMNLRGAGAGFGSARGIYHAGRTDDLRAAAQWMARRAPGSPIALVGFSLGANLVLKLAAESALEPLDGLDAVVAANPPLDLAACCRHFQRRENRVYDRHFVHMLHAEITRLHHAFPELGPVRVARSATLLEFDDLYTAPRNGFAGALEYYTRSSAGPLIPQITIPGLVVHAADDPFIPVEPFYQVCFPPNLALELLPFGGHLGYLSRTLWSGDCRWLDTRLTAWLASHWATDWAGGDHVPVTESTLPAKPSRRPEQSCLASNLINSAPPSRSSSADATS
jgi:predicted alpha/beta-fold hydrolase